MSKIVFKPVFVQNGVGPHLLNFAYAADENGDVFKAEIDITEQGIEVSGTNGRKFSLFVRWNVEGYGYLFFNADNGGEYYAPPESGDKELNLVYELAKSRVNKNRRRVKKFVKEGYEPSREIAALLDISGGLLEDAETIKGNEYKFTSLCQEALKNALWAADKMEIEKARHDVELNGYRPEFMFGCDTRGVFQMDEKLFYERFEEVFDFATITHYLKGDIVDFEPEEGKKQFSERDRVLDKLLEMGITVEGRPLFWVHTWVTPDWLRTKKYPDLLKYVEDHITGVINHYGDRIKIWEVVNEMHDWANELRLNPDQTVELTKIACDAARAANSGIKLLINNCCPFADYIQKGKWHEIEAAYPQRTPHQFTQDIVDAGVDFDLIGAQVYFTRRSFADQVQTIERYREFGKKVYLAEVGAPSIGTAREFIEKEEQHFSSQPYEWTRHWDEELQADWLEYVFTYGYSQKFVEAANWYDFVDPYAFLKSGGLLRSPEGETKAAYHRLKKLQNKWKNLPGKQIG